MPYDDGYAPVSIEDEEEERLRRGGYAPVIPSAPAAGTANLEAAPAIHSYAAPKPEVGSTEDLESKIGGPHDYAPATPPPARPTWDQYEPAERHGWSKFGSVLASINPIANRIVNEMPQEKAENRYKAATGEFDKTEEQNRLEGTAASAEVEQAAKTRQADAATAKDDKAAQEVTLAQQHADAVRESIEHGQDPGQSPKVQQLADQITGLQKQTAPTQEQNKLAYQGIIGKIDQAGLPTDPKQIGKSADAALKKGLITPQEHASLRSYEAANPTPATNLTVHVAGQEEGNTLAINRMFEGKEVLAHMPDGSRVQMSYADAKAQGVPPERLVALNANEAQQNRDKIASMGATFRTLNNYRKDLKETGGQLTGDDRKAMEVLTSHVHTAPGFLEKAASGVLDSVFGEPLTGYSEKYLGGLMTKEQYNALSPAGRQLISDYYTAVIANFANMKNIMGSVGRNEMQLQAEVATIPLPYLDWQSANDAFENKRGDIQARAASMPALYQPPKK